MLQRDGPGGAANNRSGLTGAQQRSSGAMLGGSSVGMCGAPCDRSQRCDVKTGFKQGDLQIPLSGISLGSQVCAGFARTSKQPGRDARHHASQRLPDVFLRTRKCRIPDQCGIRVKTVNYHAFTSIMTSISKASCACLGDPPHLSLYMHSSGDPRPCTGCHTRGFALSRLCK